jgi:plastocyanin
VLSGETDINIEGFAFNPGTITVQTGTTVKWVNKDSDSHTVVAEDGSFKSPRLGQGESFSFTFTKAGTFAYRCGIHASMKGTIVVVSP